MSKLNDMFTGKRITNKEVPFEDLTYATDGASVKEGMMMSGTRGFISEISRVMDAKREFYGSDVFPWVHPSLRPIYEEVLESFREIGITEGVSDGKYRAKEKVFVKNGMFKIPKKHIMNF
jgi:hypothetical protein